MSRVVWTAQAKADLREIREYIARDSRLYACRTIERIRAGAASCRQFPEAAAIVPEFGDADVRETFVGNYRVVFRLTPKTITVLTVIHAARRLHLPSDLS
jgi:toxin ParE1/3/4